MKLAGLTLAACWVVLTVLVLLAVAGCPGPKPVDEPIVPTVVPTVSPAYPPDYYEDVEDALKASTPDDSKFPFDPEGTNCPDDSSTTVD